MHREFYFDSKPQTDLWDGMWTIRTIEQELEACDLETPARDLFLACIPKGGRIIDGGCGFGKWVIYLKHRGYDIVGIDNNELAISKLKDYDSSLQVELGDILDIHYPDSSFDAYISMGVVEHFEDGPTSALKEAYRILRPGGLIFVSVPTVNIVRKIVRRPLRSMINKFYISFITFKLGWGKSKRDAILGAIGAIIPRRRGRYYHFMEYRYSKSELENFLRQAGFEVIKTVPHDLYGARGHAAGLSVDFPFLTVRDEANFRLNPVGTLISRALNNLSPWIACSSVLCVGRLLKE